MYTYVSKRKLKRKKESRAVITRDWREGEWELLFNGYRVSIWDDEKALEMDIGDGCVTM